MASQAPVKPSPAGGTGGTAMTEGQKKALIVGGVVGAVVLIVALIVAAVYLVSHPEQAASIRDVFIIFMALEFIVIGAALVVLMFQLAVLTNMLQHEIKPILDSTNETINTVRGTTTFLSDNLVGPVVKLNTYLAAIAQVADSLSMLGRFGRRKH
jgi:predicted tellurium resistance membrane protein TerC